MKLLLAIDNQIDAEIHEAENERRALLDRFVAVSSRLAELQAVRDVRASTGTALDRARLEVA